MPRERTSDNPDSAASLSLFEWARVADNSDPDRLRHALAKLVGSEHLDAEVEKARTLIRDALGRGIFVDGAPIVLVRCPGRARIFGGHCDLPSIGGMSVDVATHQSFLALVQRTADSRVRAENLDPSHPPVDFGISDSDALPSNARKIQGRSDWLHWTRQQSTGHTWEGLLRGTLAFIRTAWLDSDRQRRRALENQGLRILVSESDLPSGKGLSASSALPAGLGIALNALWEPQPGNSSSLLSSSELKQLDYAAYLVGDLGGMSDITAILEGRRGEATVLWYAPDRVDQRPLIPDVLRVFAVDSGVDRMDGPGSDDWLSSFSRHTKTLGNMTPPLAVLWMRHLSRTVEELRPLEEILRSSGSQASRCGLLRELTPAGALSADSCPAGFVDRLLEQVPNNWTLERIQGVLYASLPDLRQGLVDLAAELAPLGQQSPSEARIPMRQMACYGIREIRRGIAYIIALSAGDISTLVRLSNQAHDGDRAIYDPFRRTSKELPALTAWGRKAPKEAFQRSLPVIDAWVDQFRDFMDQDCGPEQASARISGAGLGGLISIHVAAQHHQSAVDWWSNRGHSIIQIDPSQGASLVRLSL